MVTPDSARFVLLRMNNPSVDKSFSHLFFYCPTVRAIHVRIEALVLNIDREWLPDTKLNWFGFPAGLLKNRFYALFFLSIQYFIWKAKLGNKLLVVSFVLGESVHLLDNLS